MKAYIKNLCDWMQFLDHNGDYTDLIKQWDGITKEKRINELEYLKSVLMVWLDEEEEKRMFESFEKEIKEIEKLIEKLRG